MAAILKLKNKIFHEPEDEIDFDSFVRFALLLYKILIFDFAPLQEDASFWKRTLYFIRDVYVRIYLVCFILCFISMIAFGVVNSDDFASAATAIPNATITLLISLKAWIIFLRKKDIWDILQEMKKMFDRRIGQNQKYEVKKYLDNYHRYIGTYAGVYGVFIFPIALPVVPYLLYGSFTMSVNYWFPFDIYRQETYPIYLIWTDWNAVNLSVAILAADAMLFCLITMIAMEFEVLKIDLQNIKHIKISERQQRIADLTYHHNRLVDMSDKLQEIFDLTFLYSLVISSLVMCFIAFELSLASANVATYAYYMPFLCMTVGLIFLLCVFGQKLIDSSEAVAEGIYDSGWEDFHEHAFKKQFILILLRAQKAKKFTAMNFATISLPSFTTVSLIS